jgi:hypothetical protein
MTPILNIMGVSETISQLNGIKDKLTTVSECIDTETGVSSSKKSDFSGTHRMVILQNCFVADTLINQAGTQIPALIDNVKNTLETIPPGTKLLSWEEGVRFQVGTVITQAALNETAANCATSPAKKESKNYEICNLTNGAIKAVYIPKSGQGDKHWAFQLDHPSVSGWVKEYVPGVATTNRYAVCLKTEVLADGTCEYKEYDLEKGQYVGVLAADHMARMYAFLFEMIATGGTAPTVGVAAIESILMIAGEVCQTINFTEGNDMVLLLNAVNAAYQIRHGRAMSLAERQALEGALNSTDDGISFFKKYKEKGKAFFDELAGKIRGIGFMIRVYKNVSYEDFIKTFSANDEQYKKAFQLWGEDKWDELYQYFKTNNLNYDTRIDDVWPPFDGFRSITKAETGNQLVGKIFDRFQGVGRSELGGRFASPVYGDEGVGNLHFTYDSRALGDAIEEGSIYIKFKFKNNLPPDLKFDYGDVQPWFGKQGLGDQVKSSRLFSELNDEGYIEIVEKLEYRNGKWQ